MMAVGVDVDVGIGSETIGAGFSLEFRARYVPVLAIKIMIIAINNIILVDRKDLEGGGVTV